MSKELEALEQLSKLVFVYGGVEQYRLIESALKALEIIKEKRVNVNQFLKSCGAKGKKREWQYNKTITDKSRWLTPEEYDLLKEVLL